MTDYFALTTTMRDQAAKQGFTFEMKGRWFLSRDRDKAVVWPHIDGYISAFIRDGMYVKHKKYTDFNRALDRRFGDNDE